MGVLEHPVHRRGEVVVAVRLGEHRKAVVGAFRHHHVGRVARGEQRLDALAQPERLSGDLDPAIQVEAWPQAQQTMTVLVVDDDREVLDVAVAVLAGAGYAVLHADSPAKALAVLGSTEQIDLLFTDIVMPPRWRMRYARCSTPDHRLGPPRPALLRCAGGLRMMERRAGPAGAPPSLAENGKSVAEIELKLAVKPQDLMRARDILAGRSGQGPAPPTTLVSVYYDTPKRGLAQRELMLRVRKHGRRYIQTVKGRAPGGGDLLARGEWEDAIGSERPDLAAPHGGPALQRAAKDGELRPLFKTVVRRTTIPLEPGSSTRIEAALDEGEVRVLGRDAAEPISEIELELKNGSPAVLYDVALRLLEAVPLRIETRSKAQRGYDLVDGARRPPVVHAQAFAIAPDMTVDAVLHGIGLACLAPVQQNAPAALAGVPDAIHQMRVSARRLRSLLSAVKPMLSAEHYRWANDELKWLLDALGDARNWHVFAESLLKPAKAALPLPPDLDPLLRGVERAQSAATERATEAIRSGRYTDSLLKLLRWFAARGWRDQPVSEHSARLMAPIGDLAPALIGRRYRQAMKRSRNFAKLDLAQRHKLRIALKKLRYLSEFLGDLFDPREVKTFLRALKPLQDALGSANDVRAAHDLLARRDEATGGPAVERAAGLVLGWHDRGLADREPKLRKQVRRFRKAEPFW